MQKQFPLLFLFFSSIMTTPYAQTRSASPATLTVDDIEELRVSVMNKIDTFGNIDDGPEFKPLIGSILRLVFHDCAGPYNPGSDVSTLDNTIRLCDGCIDLQLADHGGLPSFAQEPIEEICQQFSDRINRADCWASIGNVALEYAASLSSTPGTLPTLSYFIGRTECPTSPDAVTNLETGGTEFPLAHLGWDPLLAFFQDFFDFTIQEATVIVGAHTVGRAHKTGSGFDGKWTADSFAFNNQFFINLLNKNNQWDQTPVASSPFPQWSNMGRTQSEPELMMLTSDIGLVAAVEDHGQIDEATGVVTCRWEEFNLREEPICPREQSFDDALIYARDNQKFLDDFVLAWTKIVTHNQFGLTEVIPKPFEDTRNGQVPTRPPALILNENGGNNGVTEGFCCIAKKIPNWNGRCWGAKNEADCAAVAPGNGYRCYWDPLNCRQTQMCSVRDIPCTNNMECCSMRCRPDNGKCR